MIDNTVQDQATGTEKEDEEEKSTFSVGWSKPPTVRDLKQDLQDAKPIHDNQVSKIENWLENLNVTGKAAVKARKGSSSIVPKLIRKQAEWRYAALSEPFLGTDNIFSVKPVTWEDRDAAKQNQLLLNHQFNNGMDKIRFIDEYIRAAVDEGTVIVRTGWETASEKVEKEVPTLEFFEDESIQPMLQYLDQLKVDSPSQYLTDVPDELKQAHEMSQERGVPINVRITGSEKKTVDKIIYNRPTAQVCDFRNVVIDPTAMGDINKANFVIYSFESSKAELEKDGKYKNLDKIIIDTNSVLAAPDHAASDGSKNFTFNDEPRKKFVVHEYWGFRDVDGSGLLKSFVAAWVGETMIRLEENPYPDKALPFVIEHYLPVRKSCYGEPDGALLEDNQKILGAVTRGMIDIMGKSANGQTGIRKDMLDITNKRRYEAGQDYEFNPNVDPRQGVYMHTYPEIPASAQFILQLQNQEAESITGVKSWTQGVSGNTLGDVAAGVRGALDAASKRELGILRRLSNGIVAIGRKWISMNSEFLSEEEVIRVTNDEFVMVRRDDLSGAFDLKLSISTVEEDNNKAEQLAFMLQTNAANMDPELAKMIYADIATLRKMPDLAKKIESFQPQPDPLAQEEAQLRIELLRAQIAKENAQAQSYMAGAQLDVAKIGTEQVKAEDIKATADQKNLDFVEQESGVKQERSLEMAGAQARGNMALEAMKREDRREKNQVDLLKEYIKQRNKPAAT